MKHFNEFCNWKMLSGHVYRSRLSREIIRVSKIPLIVCVALWCLYLFVCGSCTCLHVCGCTRLCTRTAKTRDWCPMSSYVDLFSEMISHWFVRLPFLLDWQARDPLGFDDAHPHPNTDACVFTWAFETQTLPGITDSRLSPEPFPSSWELAGIRNTMGEWPE